MASTTRSETGDPTSIGEQEPQRKMDKSQKAQSPFNLPDTSYDEYRNQEVVETGDGGFFVALDEMFDVVPRTDLLFGDEEKLAL